MEPNHAAGPSLVGSTHAPAGVRSLVILPLHEGVVTEKLSYVHKIPVHASRRAACQWKRGRSQSPPCYDDCKSAMISGGACMLAWKTPQPDKNGPTDQRPADSLHSD